MPNGLTKPWSRRIFLHFINREAFEACDARPDYDYMSNALEILTITHCCGLSVNISQLLEFSGNNKRFLGEVFSLSSHDILEMQSQSVSTNDFISGRQNLYEHDRERYPMYFGDHAYFAENFRIGHVNRVSTTAVLQNAILELAPGPLFLASEWAVSNSDWELIKPRINDIQAVTAQHRDRAVTRALYGSFSAKSPLSKPELDAVARLVSGLYIKNFVSKGAYALCSGVRGLSYYDRPNDFPYYDIEILAKILKILGYTRMQVEYSEAIREERLSLYAGDCHRRFVRALHSFVGAAYRAIISEHRPPTSCHISTLRSMLYQSIADALSVEGGSCPYSVSLDSFFETSVVRIKAAAKQVSKRSSTFADAWIDGMNAEKNRKSVLLLTATEVETDELFAELSHVGFRTGELLRAGNNVIQTFSSEKALTVWQVRSSAGSVGSNSATLVASDAVSALDPNYVISVGICFGTNKQKQKIGDIVVAREVYHYEPGRVTDGAFLPRGQKLPTSPFLLQMSQRIRVDGIPRHEGVVASGEKLVDSRDFVEYLHVQQREVVAGEMEGSGISSVAQREHRDWILIKAICDWGYKKDKKHQAAAAQNAARFVSRMLEQIASMS